MLRQNKKKKKKKEKHQRVDSKAKRNKDGWGWQRLKRIGNDDFEKFSQLFSKYKNGAIALEVPIAPLCS